MQQARVDKQANSVEALYELYGDRIYHFCFELCGNEADAEDLAQDVFVSAHHSLPQFEGRSSVVTWLYGIAINRWNNLKRATVPTRSLEGIPEGRASTGDRTSAQLERLSLEDALKTLPDPLREAFLLVRSEGLKYREAAEVLQVPLGTVQSRVHAAAMHLRGRLADDRQRSPGGG